MWHDIETDDDYLNFGMMVNSVYDTIVEQYDDAPLSFGISGSWGSGKSSFAKQLKKKFEGDSRYILCDFNAWLYQGFEDSKIALLTTVANRIATLDGDDKSKWKETASKTIGKFRKWKKLANATISIIPGISGLAGKVNDSTDAILDAFDSILGNATVNDDIASNIEAFRSSIENKLESSDKKLIVFIDDLDRCLPDVALETLEAMRLMLFVRRTIFIIAADKKMIENAVFSRFNKGGENGLNGIAASYFDKLIQTPVNIPVVGQSEALVYLLSLLAEYHYGKLGIKTVSSKVSSLGMSALLSNAWKEPITSELIHKCLEKNDKDLVKDCFESGTVIDSLINVVPMLIKTEAISGNPRLLKRFIHTHILAVKIANQQGIPIQQDVHLKLLAIERSNPKLYEMLNKQCAEDGTIGDPTCFDSMDLTDLEKQMVKDFTCDLRPYFYLSRVASNQILTDVDPHVAEILSVILRFPNPTITDSEKNELDKLSLSQLESLSRLLMKEVRRVDFSNLYFSHFLYVDNKIKSETVLNFIASIPDNKMGMAERTILWMAPYKDNTRYDGLRKKYPKKR